MTAKTRNILFCLCYRIAATMLLSACFRVTTPEIISCLRIQELLPSLILFTAGTAASLISGVYFKALVGKDFVQRILNFLLKG